MHLAKPAYGSGNQGKARFPRTKLDLGNRLVVLDRLSMKECYHSANLRTDLYETEVKLCCLSERSYQPGTAEWWLDSGIHPCTKRVLEFLKSVWDRPCWQSAMALQPYHFRRRVFLGHVHMCRPFVTFCREKPHHVSQKEAKCRLFFFTETLDYPVRWVNQPVTCFCMATAKDASDAVQMSLASSRSSTWSTASLWCFPFHVHQPLLKGKCKVLWLDPYEGGQIFTCKGILNNSLDDPWSSIICNLWT